MICPATQYTRYREDCQKLAQFVQRIEAFITETEDETDMTGPGWKKAFSVSCIPHRSSNMSILRVGYCALQQAVVPAIRCLTMSLMHVQVYAMLCDTLA